MGFFTIFKYELQRIFRDPAIVLTIVGGVIMYSFLYPQPYVHQSVSKLNISLVDLDKSSMSRDIIFKLNATAQINIGRRDNTLYDAKQALLEDKIKAIVVIPPHFERDIRLHKSPIIAVGADSSYFLIYGAVLEGAMKSILTQGAGIKVLSLLEEQVPFETAKNSYSAYSLQTLNLFNKDNSYIQYVIPAVFVLILQQIILIGLGILGGGINEDLKEKKEGYYWQGAIWKMYLSRVLIFFSLFFVHLLFYFGYSFELFSVTRLASIYDLLTFAVPFLFACIAFGLFLGSLFSSRESATPVVLFSSLPLLFSVGFVWPVEALPPMMHTLFLCIPSTPAIEGFLALNQMGAGLDNVIGLYGILWIQSVIYMLLATVIFKFRRQSRQ